MGVAFPGFHSSSGATEQQEVISQRDESGEAFTDRHVEHGQFIGDGERGIEESIQAHGVGGGNESDRDQALQGRIGRIDKGHGIETEDLFGQEMTGDQCHTAGHGEAGRIRRARHAVLLQRDIVFGDVEEFLRAGGPVQTCGMRP